MPPLRVLIVNDSPTMRATLRLAIESARDAEIVGELADGAAVVDAVARLRPSVVLMDVIMPFNGYEATRAVMQSAPTPVVMVTAAEDVHDESVVIEALGAGALAITRAPPGPLDPGHRGAAAALVQLLRTMAGAKIGAARRESSTIPPRIETSASEAAPGSDHVVVIGIVASAGGPPALVDVLAPLAGRSMPPILVVQHMVAGFVGSFAGWLGSETRLRVVVASAGAALERGVVYVAPEDRHLGARRDLTAIVSDAASERTFRPSGDFLLRSLARSFGPRAVGVVLTGMGSDGVDGAAELERAGGVLVAQDAATAVVDGMPRAVRERCTSARVVPLAHVADTLAELVRGGRGR